MAGAADGTGDRLAVVLFNLGGPDQPAAVEPFLFNLFSDPAIIRLPGWLRRPVARLIAWRRAPIARAIYAQLGGGSPLLANTKAQAEALEAALANSGRTVRVFIAMRYWHPFSAETARAVRHFAPARILLLPLYPQYSTTTTASSLAAWRAAASEAGLGAPSQLICCYPVVRGFIATLAGLARRGLAEARAKAPAAKPILIFTAHGLPVKIVKTGDPYVGQVHDTCMAVVASLNMAGDEWDIGFQSRVGPVEWVGPGTDELIVKAAEEKRAIVLLPVAFVSEHSETLVELDIEYRRLAVDRDAPAYIRLPTVSSDPAFIAGLAALANQALADGRPIVPIGNCPASARGCPCRAANGALA